MSITFWSSFQLGNRKLHWGFLIRHWGSLRRTWRILLHGKETPKPYVQKEGTEDCRWRQGSLYYDGFGNIHKPGEVAVAHKFWSGRNWIELGRVNGELARLIENLGRMCADNWSEGEDILKRRKGTALTKWENEATMLGPTSLVLINPSG